jgi:hypothetical protein
MLAAAFFLLFAHLVFSKVSYPEFVFPTFALILTWWVNKPEKNTFLETIFSSKKCLLIRLLENTSVLLPFLIFLSIEGYHLQSAATLCLGLLVAVIPRKTRSNVVIPSPFSRYPYEFTIGFRKSYWLIALLFAVTVISLFADNAMLGLVGLAGAFFVCMNFYADAEPVYYVFTHAQSTDQFLRTKIKVSLVYTSYIILPLAVPLAVVFPSEIPVITLVILLGLSNVVLCLLGKYTDYPGEIKLIQMLKITGGILFPPILLLLIPHFYIRAKSKLNYYLK